MQIKEVAPLRSGWRFRSGAALTDKLAAEIYAFKIALRVLADFSGMSSNIARIFNVSPKAVRDIWNHSSWKHATRHLWENDKNKSNAQLKQDSCISREKTVRIDSPAIEPSMDEDVYHLHISIGGTVQPPSRNIHTISPDISNK
jgi:hypothetical protein